MIVRAKTFRAWMEANLKDYLSDIARYGCQGGFPQLTYNSDTTKLYEKFKDEIWEMLNDDAQDMGMNIFEMIGTFNGAASVEDRTTFENLMVWYAAERIARELTDD